MLYDTFILYGLPSRAVPNTKEKKKSRFTFSHKKQP